VQPEFTSLPLVDRLTALPLIKALLEYNNTEVGHIRHTWPAALATQQAALFLPQRF
jgi:hypothetical protein